jgi:hypothetical protein
MKLAYISVLYLVAVSFSVPCVAQSPDLPPDVAKFTADRDQCDHFRGEDSDDPARQKQIAAALNKYCKGTDKKLKGLKEKYHGQEAVLSVLSKYDERVE